MLETVTSQLNTLLEDYKAFKEETIRVINETVQVVNNQSEAINRLTTEKFGIDLKEPEPAFNRAQRRAQKRNKDRD